MTDQDMTDREALKALEWGGAEAAYPEALWPCCPVCGAVKPSERLDNYWFSRPGAFTTPEGQKLAEANAEKDPTLRPNGPAHEPDCWLGKRLDEEPG